MDPIRFTRPRSRQTDRRCAGLPDARQWCADAIPGPFYPLFDPATKWLGQGKAFEYAQQNVNLNRVSWRPQALAGQGLHKLSRGRPRTRCLEGLPPRPAPDIERMS